MARPIFTQFLGRLSTNRPFERNVYKICGNYERGKVRLLIWTSFFG